ncbi:MULTISPECIES: chemotaxis protein CheW [Desulfovibrio]|jgi:purine-binding chemotaxis protein CheW|uniref:chemotaxis protein CheW n=1 Tax=Desulfovibrio TaxID=872 RepID=UPI0003F4B804|nr:MULTISPECIES: chemotaxis protein CheW [Desulfovibrio]MDY0307569.1 chemotaxis protein CheW [Desulfovibrionaceae bacterium]HMM37711.1 chemotaxis protein CheW [Desulfovibrio sp.]
MDENAAKDINQFLTFTLGKEIFALDIGTVREVLELTTITKIPRTPAYMRGVINLRGHAVPVVDMRLKLGMSKGSDTVDTCIIIVEIDFDGERTVMGALVDSVREVFEMAPEAIEPAPRMGAAVNAEYIRGMGRQDENFIIILDIGRIFSAEELALVRGMGQKDAAPREAAA